MLTYYRVDTRKLTFAELWRISPRSRFLLAAWMKLTGAPIRTTTRVPLIDGLTLLDEKDVPADVKAHMEPHLRGWRDLSFRLAFYYTVPIESQGLRGFSAALLNDDRLISAQVMFIEKQTQLTTRRELLTQCMSYLDSGMFLGAGTSRKKFNTPPEVRWIHRPGGTPAELISLHRRSLKEVAPRCATELDPGSLPEIIARMSRLHVEHMVRRAVYVADLPTRAR